MPYGMNECPMCGKLFCLAPMNVYKIKNGKNVCSYSCMRKYQMKKEKTINEIKQRKIIIHQLNGGM